MSSKLSMSNLIAQRRICHGHGANFQRTTSLLHASAVSLVPSCYDRLSGAQQPVTEAWDGLTGASCSSG